VKVGVLQFFAWNRRVPLPAVYERALHRVDVMDESGYDAVWLAEHHFNTYSVCPSVTLMATTIAARTKRLRIGTAVTLAALYHPLRLAEELALVDVLSGGRLNWGAGRGFDATEFRAFAVPPEESSPRFREAVDVVLAAWRNERVTFSGRWWQFDGIEVLPKPLQQPHPPVRLAATSHDSIRRAAADGFDILMDPHAGHDEIGRKRSVYLEALTEAGHSAERREIPVARLLAIAATDAEAERVARAGAQWTLGSYASPETTGLAGGDLTPRDPVERYVGDVIIHGTPERVVDELQRLRETIGLDYLLAAPLSQETFELLTTRVVPRL
jgi:alkanesulfonate monooxygenase SsuD/methylene tetrahydromethanopterin reductase-like flavin-dependent oxidoreductase (luciferase family)